MQIEQYKQLMQGINVLTMSPANEQADKVQVLARLLTDYQTKTPYKMVQPIVAEDIAPENRIYSTVNSVIYALLQQEHSKEWIYGNIQEEMRKNKEAMLGLLENRPEAYSIVAHELQKETDFILQAVSNNAHVYDLLPPEQRQDPEIAKAYFVATLQGKESFEHHSYIELYDSRKDPETVDFTEMFENKTYAHVFVLHPECPFNNPSLDAYQIMMEQLILHPDFVQTYDTNLDMTIPAAALSRAQMLEECPELLQDFLKKEQDAYMKVFPLLQERQEKYQQAMEDAERRLEIATSQKDSYEISEIESDMLSIDFYYGQSGTLKEFLQSDHIKNCERGSLCEINPYTLTSWQTKMISDKQLALDAQYVPVSPAIGIRSDDSDINRWVPTKPLTAPFQVKEALVDIDMFMLPGDLKQEAIANVWANISDDMRNNKEQMLQLIEMCPEGLAQASSSVLNKEYVAEAMRRNPRVYDVLPPQMQKNNNVIDIYRDSLVNSYKAQFAETKKDGILFGGYNVNPNCPEDKLYSVEGYQKVFEQVLLKNGITFHNEEAFGYHTAIDPMVTFLATARRKFPELAQQYDKAEIAAYGAVKDKVAEIAGCRYGYELQHHLQDFADKHSIDMPFAQWKQAADNDWSQTVAQIAESMTSPNAAHTYIATEVARLMEHVDHNTIEQHMDLSDFWQKTGRVMANMEINYALFPHTEYEPHCVHLLREKMQLGELVADNMNIGRLEVINSDSRVVLNEHNEVQNISQEHTGPIIEEMDSGIFGHRLSQLLEDIEGDTMKTLLDDKMFQILHIMRDWSSDTLQELTESELYTLDSCFIDLGYDIAYLCTDKKLFSEVQNGLYELAEEISNHPIREYIQEKMQTGQQDFANSNPNQAFISFQEIIDSVEPEIEERIQ